MNKIKNSEKKWEKKNVSKNDSSKIISSKNRRDDRISKNPSGGRHKPSEKDY